MKTDNNANTLGDEYLDVKALQRALGLSKGTIYALCRKGKFPEGTRFGTARRWSATQLREWLASRAGGTGNVDAQAAL